MSNQANTPIFISSAHYGLEDLRGELTSFLCDFGATPYVSSENGFHDYGGMTPYAQCLKTLEKCLIVIGILDRRYEQTFEKWEPYEQFNGLSPTHAEFRHAIQLNKRFLLYVRADIASYYDIYRKNKRNKQELVLPDGVDVKSLELYEELKLHHPHLWIEKFNDVRDIKNSIRRRLLNDLSETLLDKENQANRNTKELIEKLVKKDPSLWENIQKEITKENGLTYSPDEIKTLLQLKGGEKKVDFSKLIDETGFLSKLVDTISKSIVIVG